MKVSVYGLGYVGVISGACFARLGHQVLGVDINESKVASINEGRSPIVEAGLAELVGEQVQSRRLSATEDGEMAAHQTDISLVSVGTPGSEGGEQSLTGLESVLRQIGSALRTKSARHAIVIRSTVLPGTTAGRLRSVVEEAAHRAVGDRLSLAFNPEFLREGNSIHDFENPPFTLFGAIDPEAKAIPEGLYDGIAAPIFHTSSQVAESVKYVSNAFHAAKIAFANEVGVVLRGGGVDAREVMRIVCEDTTLNISPAYLKPGFAFGGSCLPKDLRAFVSMAERNHVKVPFLGHLLESNDRHVDRAFEMVVSHGRPSVALIGLAFKSGTDDLRESPFVSLAERILGRGLSLRIYDRQLEMSNIIGANREFIAKEIPHLERFLARSVAQALEGADVVVVGHLTEADLTALRDLIAGKKVIDLSGHEWMREMASAYEGIAWT